MDHKFTGLTHPHSCALNVRQSLWNFGESKWWDYVYQSFFFLLIRSQPRKRWTPNTWWRVTQTPNHSDPVWMSPVTCCNPIRSRRQVIAYFVPYLYFDLIIYLTLMHYWVRNHSSVFWLALMGLPWHFHRLPVTYQLYNWLPEALIF